jgi:hypothetical protein
MTTLPAGVRRRASNHMSARTCAWQLSHLHMLHAAKWMCATRASPTNHWHEEAERIAPSPPQG